MLIEDNFDIQVNRFDTECIKYDSLDRFELKDKKNALAMWIADMDFLSPKTLTEEIIRKTQDGIFGYAKINKNFKNSIIKWQERKDIIIKEEDILYSTSVVSSIMACLLAFSNENDDVLIQTPCYTKFSSTIKQHKRNLLTNELVLENNHYKIDFNDLENKIKIAKIFLLCSPNNPTGKLFTQDEIKKIIHICQKHNTLLISDEIHSDIVFDNENFYSINHFDDKTNNHIVLNSASKTFNIAGLNTSYIIVKNDTLRRKLGLFLSKYHLNHPSTFGTLATSYAYTNCNVWKNDLVNYLQTNKDMVYNFINKNIQIIKVIKNQATYLMWLDFRQLKQTHNQINQRLLNKGLVLNSGLEFDKNSDCFFRVNIAVRKNIVEEFLKRLKEEFQI